MYSIRNLLAAALVALVGCQRANEPQVMQLNPEPIIADDAMQYRTWNQTSAMYPNGDTVAGPTLFNCEPRRGMNEYKYAYTDAGVFAGNVFMLPYRFYQMPPWRTETYPGEVIAPSYTAMPALPPEPFDTPMTPAAESAPPTTQPRN